MNLYEIDYEYGKAKLWTPDNSWRRFYDLAGQCFGIRKSIGETKLIKQSEDDIPKPWVLLKDVSEVLEHSGGDTIAWNSDGEKIKSEWD